MPVLLLAGALPSSGAGETRLALGLRHRGDAALHILLLDGGARRQCRLAGWPLSASVACILLACSLALRIGHHVARSTASRVVLIHFRIIWMACILRGVNAGVDVASSLVRRAADVGSRAVPVVEELLVVVSVCLLLVAAHHAEDPSAEPLPRLLGLVAVVRRVRAAVVAHDARLLRDIAEVVRLVPPQLLHAASVVHVAILVVAAIPTANGGVP